MPERAIIVANFIVFEFVEIIFEQGWATNVDFGIMISFYFNTLYWLAEDCISFKAKVLNVIIKICRSNEIAFGCAVNIADIATRKCIANNFGFIKI